MDSIIIWKRSLYFIGIWFYFKFSNFLLRLKQQLVHVIWNVNKPKVKNWIVSSIYQVFSNIPVIYLFGSFIDEYTYIVLRTRRIYNVGVNYFKTLNSFSSLKLWMLKPRKKGSWKIIQKETYISKSMQ